jgi:hypothetical protein
MSTPIKIGALVLLAAVGLGLWVWNMAHVPALVNDDAFIFMRYAVNWVDHGILAWNREAVGGDGFTSFAYQVLAAFAYRLAGDPVSALWYVSALLSAATVLLTLLLPLAGGLGDSPRPRATMLAAFAATCVSSALSPQFVYFTQSLMETSLVAVAVCLASWGAASLLTDTPAGRWRGVIAGLALGSLALVRPEGLIVAAVVWVLLALRLVGSGSRSSLFRGLFADVDTRSAGPLAAGLLAAGLIAGTFYVWHLVRYHHPFPNPVYVKTAGVQGSSIRRGVEYLWQGPAAGSLPLGATRSTASSPAERVDRRTVHAAINPDGSPLPHLALLSLLPIVWCLSVPGAVFSGPRDALFLRHFLLIPTGWLMLVVVAGGDASHSGWRFVTPLLPVLTMAAVLGVRWIRSPAAAWVLFGMLALVGLRVVVVSFDRPKLCGIAASACGIEAIRGWPSSLERYDWDVTNSWQDGRLARALEASFGPDAVVGQADFLRIGAHLPDLKIADLSGLTDPELAHSQHGPEIRLFTSDLLMDVRPEVFLYGYRFVSEHDLAGFHLGDPGVSQLLYPWPPKGSSEGLRKLVNDYAGASVGLPDGTFFNFLVLREAVPAMTSREQIAVGE